MSLTLKQQNFVYAYIECGNATEAYKRAYGAIKMKPHAIEVEASKLMQNEKVLSAIEAAKSAHWKRHEVTVDRMVQELANIVFANPKDFMEWGPDGVTIKESHELTDQQAACIAEVYSRPTKDGVAVRLKLSDKQAAIDKLNRTLGVYIERKEVGGPGAFSDMSDEELDEFITTNAAEVLPQIRARKAPARRERG